LPENKENKGRRDEVGKKDGNGRVEYKAEVGPRRARLGRAGYKGREQW